MICGLAVLAGCDGASTAPTNPAHSIGPPNAGPPVGDPASRVTIKIEFGGQANDIEFISDWKTGITVFDVLTVASQEKKFPMDASGAGITAFIKSINGVVGGRGGNKHWIYFVNGEIAHSGSGVYLLQPGDSVVWRMGKYQ